MKNRNSFSRLTRVIKEVSICFVYCKESLPSSGVLVEAGPERCPLYAQIWTDVSLSKHCPALLLSYSLM